MSATGAADAPSEAGGPANAANVSRRGFLGRSGLAGAGVAGAALAGGGATGLVGGTAESAAAAPPAAGTPAANFAPEPRDPYDPESFDDMHLTSTFFSTAFVEYAGTYAAPGSDGDLWPTCWADDDNMYAANGDGRGFSDEHFRDVVMNRIKGTPETGITGERLAESGEIANVWADPDEYNRKPTGMVCVGGVLYVAVQDLKKGDNAFNDVPNASISRSDDHGETWQKTDEAMFTDYQFTTIFFLDFGKNSHDAVRALGPRDGRYVYAYGFDWNWRASTTGTVPDPIDVYLARVPSRSVQDRARWEFFTGADHGNRPTWSSRIEDKLPVLHEPLRRHLDPRPDKNAGGTVIGQGGVLYNRPLDRYLFTSWSGGFELYESPTPWGPWNRFHYYDAGKVPWRKSSDAKHTPKNGGYGTTMPSKFVSADGCQMWLQSNWWDAPVPDPEDNYNFNLRKVKVTPFQMTRPGNDPDPKDNLARGGADVTTINTCCRAGNWPYLSDGDKSKSEDSFNGDNKTVCFWGYTFSKAYRMDKVVYTTGKMADDGGWFSRYAGGLRVQVRREFQWQDVEGLRVTPDYPYDSSAGDNTTYTLAFDRNWGDGIRIIGLPGGSSFYTSIAELEVYYRG